MKTYTVFKSDEGRETLRSYYNQVLSFFPFEQKYINTTFGKTFILHAGDIENEPVFLLHGSCSNSAFWFSEMMELSRNFHVIAIDILGEAGNSDEVRFDLNSNDYAMWLKEIADVLGFLKIILIGNSLGGWLALKFACAFGEYVSKLVLIAPSGITAPRSDFIEKSINAVLKGGKELSELNNDIVGEESMPKEVLDFINLIMQNFNPITDALPVYSDEQLSKLTMPILFIAGKEDITADSEKSAQRLISLVPHAKVNLVENCGHVVMNSSNIIIQFLEDKEKYENNNITQ